MSGKVFRVTINAKLPSASTNTYADLPFHNDDAASQPYDPVESDTGDLYARCVVCVVWDDCTEQVISALVSDVMSLAQGLPGVPIVVVVSADDKETSERLARLLALDGASSSSITVEVNNGQIRYDGNVYLRYWMKDRPALNVPADKIVDRDFRVNFEPRTDKQRSISDRLVVPTGPNVPMGRGVQPTSNPLTYQPGNPFVQPFTTFASRDHD